MRRDNDVSPALPKTDPYIRWQEARRDNYFRFFPFLSPSAFAASVKVADRGETSRARWGRSALTARETEIVSSAGYDVSTRAT